MIAGTLEIQMMANLARLTQDMNQAKGMVNTAMTNISSSVDIAKKALGALGVGLSVNAFAGIIKATVDVGDKFNDLKKITGLTVNELGGLEKQAKLNGTTLDSVSRAVGQMSKQMYNGADAFRLLGVEVRGSDGQLRGVNSVLLDVANRFSRMEDGATKSAIANQIFGKSGRDMIPMLNEGNQKLLEAIEAHRKYSGWTDRSAEQADLFNDQLAMLEGRVAGVKTRMVTDLLPVLVDISSAFVNATERVNEFSFSGNILPNILKGIAVAGYTVVDTFNGISRSAGALIAQAIALAKFDYGQYKDIGAELDRLNIESRNAYDKFVDNVMNGDQKIAAQIKSSSGGVSNFERLQIALPPAINKTTQALEKQNKAFDIELYKLKQYEADAKRARDITESVATKQEKYNSALAELQRLKPYLEVETYNRKLQALQNELNDVGSTQRTVVNEMDQLWIQAGRNIQNTLGNAVFDFFSGGMENMVVNAKNAVLRIVSEFAGLRIAQGLGLTAMFAAPGAAAAASGATGGGLGLLNMASLGTSALSLLKGGFGINAGVGGLLSVLGGNSAVGAFGAGMAGGAIPGVSSAVTMAGSSFASILGPVAALGGVDMIGRMLAGDRKLGGAEMIPVIGGFLAAMFGREPYKFRQQSLQGTVSSGGFDGDITNVFRSKGGLFTSNKHKSMTEQFSPEMQALFDATIGGFFDTVRAASLNLGIDAALVENFTKEIQIKSEKGQKLTEQAITDMLTGIGDDLAKAAMPIVDTYKKVGETSIQTLKRLSDEFAVLTSAASLLFDKSSEWSKGFISSFGFGDRTAFLDKAGGTDAFAAMVSGFAQNFLTDDQRMRPVIESLISQRDALGLGNINTRAQYVSAVQGGMLNQDQLLFLLKNQDAIKNVFDFVDAKLAKTLAVETAQKTTFDFANAYNAVAANMGKEIQLVVDSVEKLKDFSRQLAGTVDQLQPMNRAQAMNALLGYANAASMGGSLPDIETIRTPLSALTNFNTNEYTSSFDLARDRARSAGVVRSLISISDARQSDLARQIEDMKVAMTEALSRIAASSEKTSDILDSVSGGGGPLLTQSA